MQIDGSEIAPAGLSFVLCIYLKLLLVFFSGASAVVSAQEMR